MNLFTVNQVNQVYALKSGSSVAIEGKDGSNNSVTLTTNSGNIDMCKTSDGKSIYFKHAGPAGVTRSDLIDLDKIMYVTATKAKDMEVALKQYEVKVDSTALDSGSVLPNKDYILRIELTNYMGVSPEDSHYWKYGMVHTTGSMSASDFYVALAKSILKNMSREAVKFLKIYLNTNSTPGSVTLSNEVTLSNVDSMASTYYGLILQEVEPDWILGLKRQKVVEFNLTGVPFEYNGSTIYWLKGENEETELKPTATTDGVVLKNSKLTADYEYFFHGERGDQYRMVGWPDYVPTQYMVDPSYSYGYDYVQIHYYYTGPNEGAQKSEKDITFLVPGNSSSSSFSTNAARLKTAIDDAINSLGADAANAAIAAQIADTTTPSALNAAYEPKST